MKKTIGQLAFFCLTPALFGAFGVFFPKTALADTKILNATKDTYANEAYPTKNYATVGSVTISDVPIDRYGYFLFEEANLPAGAVVDQVLFKFYLHEHSSEGVARIDVGAIKDDWEESGITWNNRPGLYMDGIYGTEITLPFGWKQVEVTDNFKRWQAGEINKKGLFIYPRGILYGSPGPSFYFSLKSREADNKPYLEVTYHIPAPEPEPEPETPTVTTPAPTASQTQVGDEEVTEEPVVSTSAAGALSTPASEVEKLAEDLKKKIFTLAGIGAAAGILLGIALAVLISSIIRKKKAVKEGPKEEKPQTPSS